MTANVETLQANLSAANPRVAAAHKDPAFLIGLEHVHDAETPKARDLRLKRLAEKCNLAFDEASLAVTTLPKYARIVANTPSGLYRTTRDIPNPHYDARLARGDINSNEVLRKGITVAVTHYPKTDPVFDMPRIDIYGCRGRLSDSLLIRLVFSNMEPVTVTNLCDAVRADEIGDGVFKEIVMLLMDEKRLTLEEVRAMAAKLAPASFDDKALYARHGFSIRD